MNLFALGSTNSQHFLQPAEPERALHAQTPRPTTSRNRCHLHRRATLAFCSPILTMPSLARRCLLPDGRRIHPSVRLSRSYPHILPRPPSSLPHRVGSLGRRTWGWLCRPSQGIGRSFIRSTRRKRMCQQCKFQSIVLGARLWLVRGCENVPNKLRHKR